MRSRRHGVRRKLVLVVSTCMSAAACGARTGLRTASDSGPDTPDSGPLTDARPTCDAALASTVRGFIDVTVDDNFRIYLNGALIDDVPHVWTSPQHYAVALWQSPTRPNVIALEGSNT